MCERNEPALVITSDRRVSESKDRPSLPCIGAAITRSPRAQTCELCCALRYVPAR